MRTIPANGEADPPRGLRIGGFSSQTFDTLYKELVAALPESLARDLMHCHWRVKFLLEKQGKEVTYLDPYAEFFNGARTLREGLLARLDRYGKRSVLRLMVRRGE